MCDSPNPRPKQMSKSEVKEELEKARKQLEAKLEHAKETLEFKVGQKTVPIRMSNGDEYQGVYLGQDDEWVYMEDTICYNKTVHLERHKYCRLFKNNICAQIYEEHKK